tara:strand:+ start:1154 stop:1519 length:366 start_codon:yes stop_codon:yes gene_type:complete
MKKEILQSYTKQELFELLILLNEKLNIIESAALDNRKLLTQVVKQNNSLVKFLANLEIEEVPNDDYFPPQDDFFIEDDDYKRKTLFEILKELGDKKEELKEFEEELKRNKDKLTPGQVGES